MQPMLGFLRYALRVELPLLFTRAVGVAPAGLLESRPRNVRSMRNRRCHLRSAGLFCYLGVEKSKGIWPIPGGR